MGRPLLISPAQMKQAAELYTSGMEWIKIAESLNLKSSTFTGQRKTVAEWAEITGLPYFAIQARLTLGWTVEQTLTLPLFSSPKPV